MEKFKEFLRNEDGQTSTEYILLVAVVALIVFRFKKSAEGQLTKLTEGIFGKANEEIMSGFDEI
ncbi:Flp/Fap pilin component [Bacteriovorax sp. BSW11_IV]|uniref:Flp/Fap pilin component n=1 Tax=Bacteriovorax sp. BSW11_IV TaxID=1353529 RepID=UPI000389DA32|nr:Flp/Fap pilin component [Bacteriovorax sp. BSW11_IV]EQC46998.1 Flp/Fap pilin component [Bacteriovorax sp. BSW11_IV]